MPNERRGGSLAELTAAQRAAAIFIMAADNTDNSPWLYLDYVDLKDIIGLKVSAGTAFPASPASGDILLFTGSATGLAGYRNADDTANVTTASAGDVAQYNGTNWIAQGSIAGATAGGNSLNFGTAFPASPAAGDVFIFSGTASSLTDYRRENGLTPITEAVGGDAAKYNGTHWVRQTRLLNLIGGSTVTIGPSFPGSPKAGSIHLFNLRAIGLTGYRNTNNDAVTVANKGDTARYDGTNWIYQGRISTNTGFGTSFPNEPTTGDAFVFTGDATGLTGYVDTDGTTALTTASAGDIALRGNSNWRKQISLSTMVAGGSSLQFGDSLPSNPSDDDLLWVTSAATFEQTTRTFTRTGETAGNFPADFGSNDIYVTGGTWFIAASGADQSAITSLVAGDSIILRPASGTDVVLSLSGSPFANTYNTHSIAQINFNIVSVTGTLQEVEYTVMVVKRASAAKDSIWKYSNNLWSQEYALSTSPASKLSVQFGNAFPTSPAPAENDLFIFTAAASGLTWKDVDGTTDITSATTGDVAQRVGSDWVKRIDLIPPSVSGGTSISFGTSFPASPTNGDSFVFTAAVASGLTWYDTDGTTSLSAAARTDVAVYQSSNTRWIKQLTLDTAMSGGGNNSLTYGSAFPTSNLQTNHIFVLDQPTATLESYTSKFTRVGETSNTVADFGNANVGIFGGVFTLAVRNLPADLDPFGDLGNGDRIYLKAADDANDVVIALSDTPTVDTRNGHTIIELPATDFSATGTIVDNRQYTVYALNSKAETVGAAFRHDGNFWQRFLTVSTDSRVNITYDDTLPSNPKTGDLHTFSSENAAIERYLAKERRVGETSQLDGDFGSNEVALYDEDPADELLIAADFDFRRAILALSGGDKVVLKPDSGDNIVFTLTSTGRFQSTIQNTHSAVEAAEGASNDFTRVGTIEDGVSYTVYVLRTEVAKKGSTFEFDGSFWRAVYHGSEVEYVSSFPSWHYSGDLVELNQDIASVDRYTSRLTRVGETTLGDFTALNLIVTSSVMQIAMTAQEAAAFTALGSGDKIIFERLSGGPGRSNAGPTVATLVSAPTTSTRNSIATVTATGYALSGINIADGTSYAVYAITVGSERQGSIFRSDGRQWQRRYQAPAAIEAASDAEAATGTSTSKVMTVKQVADRDAALRNFLDRWFGGVTPVGLPGWNIAVTGSGSGWDSTNERFIVSAGGNNRSNIRIENAAIDWTGFGFLFEAEQNGGTNNGFNDGIFWATDATTINDQREIVDSNAGFAFRITPRSATAGDRRYELFASDGTAQTGETRGRVERTGSVGNYNIKVYNGATVNADGQVDFVHTGQNRIRYVVYQFGQNVTLVANRVKIATWELTAAQAGSGTGPNYGFYSPSYNESGSRYYLYRTFIANLTDFTAAKEFEEFITSDDIQSLDSNKLTNTDDLKPTYGRALPASPNVGDRFIVNGEGPVTLSLPFDESRAYASGTINPSATQFAFTAVGNDHFIVIGFDNVTNANASHLRNLPIGSRITLETTAGVVEASVTSVAAPTLVNTSDIRIQMSEVIAGLTVGTTYRIVVPQNQMAYPGQVFRWDGHHWRILFEGDGLPPVPAHTSTAQQFILNVPATSGEPTWTTGSSTFSRVTLQTGISSGDGDKNLDGSNVFAPYAFIEFYFSVNSRYTSVLIPRAAFAANTTLRWELIARYSLSGTTLTTRLPYVRYIDNNSYEYHAQGTGMSLFGVYGIIT